MKRMGKFTNYIKSVFVGVILVFMSGTIQHSSGNQILNFYIPNFPPYSFREGESIKGIGVDIVGKILDDINIKYSLFLVPNYGRALAEIKSGKSDGFFLATQNDERDRVAIFTKPVVFNRWAWFLPKKTGMSPNDVNFKTQARVGTIINTNTHTWLKKHGYNVTGYPDKAKSLIAMLKKDRIDAVFSSEAVFEEALLKSGTGMDDFIKIIESSEPFGIYISKAALLKDQNIIVNINKAIDRVAAIERRHPIP